MTNDQLFTIEVLKWIAVVVAVLSLPISVIGAIAFWRVGQGAAKTFSLLIQRGSIVRLSAIFVIIFATFVLCLANMMKPELVASIFSGVAGYVLGGAPKSEGVDEG